MMKGVPLRLLVFSSLYPNMVQPRHGIFVEERLRALLATGEVTARVIAPVPWFPSRHKRFGKYASFAEIPAREERHGVEILHPRYAVIPRVGMTLGPVCMAAAVAPVLQRLLTRDKDFDLIDAHYFYPDGVAAASLARKFGKPVVITARGSDINTIARFRLPGRQIVRAARQADAIITVSRALKQRLGEIGVPPERITPLRNGVDLKRFAPIAPDLARAKLGIAEPVWLTAGNLIELKGVHLVIEALAAVPEATLLIVGCGEEEDRLRAQAARSGVNERVRFLGQLPHNELSWYYSAADVLILASRSEGMPNVVLEAMACGTAIIATAVGGIPELVEEPTAGILMSDRTPQAVVVAWHAVVEHGIGQDRRDARRAYAQQFGWSETARGQMTLFREILDGKDARHGNAVKKADGDVQSACEDGKY